MNLESRKDNAARRRAEARERRRFQQLANDLLWRALRRRGERFYRRLEGLPDYPDP